MRALLIAVLVSAVIAMILQMFLPFPFGVIFGIGIPAIIIWRAWKADDSSPNSLLSYRRTDPKTEEEKKQNREAFRILKKKFLEGEISQEEFEKIKKDFDEDEQN